MSSTDGPRKYRLLKDLPGYPAGHILDLENPDIDENPVDIKFLWPYALQKFPDWFEPVVEAPNRCNSPYHFDLENLSAYGIDELHGAYETIFEAIIEKSRRAAVQGGEQL